MGLLENAFPEYVVFSQLDKAVNWARQNSVSFLTVDLACCGIETMQAAASRYDIERFGSVPQVSPSHADLMIVAGTLTYKAADHIKKLYEKMPYPKYVISFGSCTNCGGMFSWEYSYSTVSGLDKVIPVDLFIPGCPPRPEALLEGLIKLQSRISSERVLVQDELHQRKLELNVE